MSDHIDPEKLDRLAQVAVRTGVNLQEGQDLVITGPMAALPLVRLITKYAYKAGCGVVMPFFTDDVMLLARYEHASDESFDKAPDWFYEGLAAAFKGGAARMAISGDDPMLLAEQDPAKVARVSKANSIASKPAMQAIVGFEVNWNIVAYPSKGWASRVFPDLPAEEAQGKLMDHIFAASRLEGDDPVANWADHSKELKTRVEWLNQRNFAALKYTGPGTDLNLGLADGHIWKGGASQALNGVMCHPNIPTEEVFTCPHAYKVDGTVAATKPLAHQGTIIEDIAVRFEAGKIVEGGNQSLIHVDWMIGSDAIDIDGVTKTGEMVPVMRKGEWAF